MLGLMVTVPFLHPIHHHPIPSFYSEWWAFVFGLLAAIAALIATPLRLILPSLLKLIAIFLVAILVQWVAGMIAYREFALFHVGYLAWAAIVATLGSTLAGQIGRDRLLQAIAAAILVGALMSVGFAFAQRLNLPISHEILFPSLGGNVTGNIAQRNNLGSYLWAGIVSVLYLRELKQLTTISALACVLLLGCAAGLTGSRSVLLVGSMLIVGAITVYRGVARNDSQFRLVALGIALVMMLCAKALFSNLPDFDVVAESALERLTESNITGDARLDLWRDTLTIIGDHPWIGNGVGNFPWRMLEAASRAPIGASTFPGAEHSHNILLQIAADFGLPLSILFGTAIIIWLLRLRRSECDRSIHYSLAVLTVLLLHSLLEYPLWYASFLGIFCLVVGATDPRTSSVAYPAHRPLLPLTLVAGIAALIPLKMDYVRLDEANNRIVATPTLSDWQQRIETVAAIATTSGLGSYAIVALGALLEPDEKLAAQQLYVCERTMRLWPGPVIIARCAYLRHLIGRTEDAHKLLALAHAAFRDPEKQAAIRASLELAAKKNPAAAKLGVFVKN
jgi:O-antigen ligase